jgi:hypothetical protein
MFSTFLTLPSSNFAQEGRGSLRNIVNSSILIRQTDLAAYIAAVNVKTSNIV